MISRRRLATALLLGLVSAAALSLRLGNPPLHTDEITYMSCTLESMIQDTVFPVYGNGALFYNKPPLALWLMRASFAVLGPSPFAARLPSALAAAGVAVVVYLFGAIVLGEGAGLLGALIFLCLPGPLLLHGLRAATPDALEILLVTSAIAALELWRRRRRRWQLVGLVATLAATAWVKSPFALVVWLVYLLATELPARRAGRGTPRLLVTLSLAVGAWTAAYLLWLGILSASYSPRAVFNRLLVQQYAHRLEGRIGPAPGPAYYLETVVRDFGPLLLLPLAAGALALRRGRSDDRYQAACLAAWALAAPILATASTSKLPWYAYLSYPGAALLVAGSVKLVSGRQAIRAALMAIALVVAAARVPATEAWPAQARYHGLTGRLWDLVRRHPEVAVVAGPGFELPRGNGDDYREARLLIRALFWNAPSAAGTARCRAILVNRGSGLLGVGEQSVIELHRPQTRRRGTGLWLVDDCKGWLREQLAVPMAASEDAAPQVSILMYSGRPNPSFALTADQAERVRRLLEAARPDLEFRQQSVLPSMLGYNGLMIRNPRREGGLPQSIATYGGRIEVRDGEGGSILADGGALETLLLDLAVENKAFDIKQRRAIESKRKRSD